MLSFVSSLPSQECIGLDAEIFNWGGEEKGINDSAKENSVNLWKSPSSRTQEKRATSCTFSTPAETFFSAYLD